MNSLEIKDFNGKKVIDSRVVAERIDMLHKNLLQKIKGYEDILTGSKFSPLDFFIKYEYQDSKGETRLCYLLTKQGCEMVANKLTGEKGVLFTAEYVNAFNEMEKAIANPQIDVIKQKEVEARYMNAKARIASMWMKLANRVPSNTEYQQICNSYASEALTGEKVLPLPKCDDCYYTATEVGALLGISSKKVGSISKQHDLKNEENGKWFFDKSPYSNKEVETYKYNQKGIDAIKAVVDGGAK